MLHSYKYSLAHDDSNPLGASAYPSSVSTCSCSGKPPLRPVKTSKKPSSVRSPCHRHRHGDAAMTWSSTVSNLILVLVGVGDIISVFIHRGSCFYVFMTCRSLAVASRFFLRRGVSTRQAKARLSHACGTCGPLFTKISTG